MDPIQYVQQQQRLRPEQSQWYSSFENLYTKKLWHQLSISLFDFIEKAPGEKDLLSLHQNFVQSFELKMNPLLLVDFASKLVTQIKDPNTCIEFVKSLQPKVKQNKMAEVLCSIIIGEQLQVKGDAKGVEKLLEEVLPQVDDVDGVTPVHARFYQLSSNYYKNIGDHCKYYRNALRYLGCFSRNDDSFLKNPAEHEERAFTLALAALLGEGIFNFGELLQHPIINCISSSRRWIIDLLDAFNSGDIAQYERLRPQWSTQVDLVAHELELRKKITLMCLMEMTFKSADGVIGFEDISRQARVDIQEVEMLVMKALSLGLVKGTIDQVDGRVNLNWVQPRVLNKSQMLTLRSRLDVLCGDVKTMETLLTSKAREIIG